MWDRVVLICLGIWALITGILSVTNVQVTWGPQLAGFAALILGIVCIIRAIIIWNSGARPPAA